MKTGRRKRENIVQVYVPSAVTTLSSKYDQISKEGVKWISVTILNIDNDIGH